MKIKGGRALYGEAIGIITVDTAFPRIPGDVGNASTYKFPVRFKTVKGSSVRRVVKECARGLLESFIETAQELEKEGVRAITTSCGFLVIFQKEIADAVSIPVFTSSLLQVPLVHNLLGRGRKVGIITADSSSLTEKHLKSAGIDSISVVIGGMENEPEFGRVFFGNEIEMDVQKIEDEVVNVSKGLISHNPDVGAIVFECTNLPPYASAVQNATGLPVFDIVTFTNYIYEAVVRKKDINGFM